MRPEARSTRNTRPLTEESALHSVPATALKRPRPFEIYRDDVSAPIRKKSRHRMTDLQLERLEALYQLDTHPTREQKQALGEEVGMYVLRGNANVMHDMPTSVAGTRAL